tara:strand:+ start:10115 stop:11647 length:1533 start_codon:yes stop_codon:yes gene_type:complete
MLEVQNTKPLASRIDELLCDIKDLSCFYDHNEQMLDIFEGNLLPYVEKMMEDTLDKRYFQLIKHRILPINFTQKLVGKLAKSYGEDPLRKCDEQDFVDEYTTRIRTSVKMGLAEKYTYLNRGYALKPKLTNKGKIKVDVLPYDKFYVKADDNSDQSMPTVFVEFLGKTERSKVGKNKKNEIVEIDCYMAYSETEIIAFDSDGDKIDELTESLNDRNPIGVIPFVYGNRSVSNIVPKQDTDFLKLSKILPLMLSDINGAIMFQCFTLIYGIDVEFNDATMSPNAIWDLSSKAKSDKPATIGTLQPTVDSDKALTFFKNVLAFWLDSKGIDAGSIMQLDSQTMASGLSKAMDELDTTEARKESISYLAEEEKQLYVLLAHLNNYWMKVKEAKPLKLKKVNVQLVEDTMEVEFKEPMAKLDYTTEIDNSIKMIKDGLSYREKEIIRLSPYMSEEEIDQVFFEYGIPRYDVGSKEVKDGVDPSKVGETPPDDMNNEDPNMDEETNNNDIPEEDL